MDSRLNGRFLIAYFARRTLLVALLTRYAIAPRRPSSRRARVWASRRLILLERLDGLDVRARLVNVAEPLLAFAQPGHRRECRRPRRRKRSNGLPSRRMGSPSMYAPILTDG